MRNRHLQRLQQRQRLQQQRMSNARLQQQQQVRNTHLQRQQQQQQQRQQQEQLLQLERVRMEELEREMAEQRPLSFLESDNSFLEPWNWNPDAPSTSRPIEIERGGSFFSHNPVFSSEDQMSEDLSVTYKKQDSSDKKDVKQVPDALLDQNLPITNVGTEHEKSEDLSGTNVFVSDNSTDQINVHSSDKKSKGTSVEQVSSEFNVDHIAEQASNALSDQNLPRTTEETGKSMAEEKKQPKFSKIIQLRPRGKGSQGLNLLVKVVDTKLIKLRSGQRHLAQSLVGDETGMIIFNARNNQVDLMKEGATLILYNAKIEMFNGSMKLAVDKWGRIEGTEPATFSVKENTNLSLIEWEEIIVYGK